MNEESDSKLLPSFEKFFANFNYKATQELKLKERLYDFQGLQEKFKNIVTVGNAVAQLANEELVWCELLWAVAGSLSINSPIIIIITILLLYAVRNWFSMFLTVSLS